MVIEALLGVQLEGPPQCTVAGVLLAVVHPAHPGVHQGHGTHGARLSHHIAVVAGAEVGPVEDRAFVAMSTAHACP